MSAVDGWWCEETGLLEDSEALGCITLQVVETEVMLSVDLRDFVPDADELDARELGMRFARALVEAVNSDDTAAYIERPRLACG